MGAAEIRRTALRDADVSDFPFSALGLGNVVVGAAGGGRGGGEYLTRVANSRIVSSMGVSVDTLCRSEVLHNRIHYQRAGLPMDIVKVDVVHSELSERSLTRLASVLPCSTNFHSCCF